jgi:hypothetical protein
MESPTPSYRQQPLNPLKLVMYAREESLPLFGICIFQVERQVQAHILITPPKFHWLVFPNKAHTDRLAKFLAALKKPKTVHHLLSRSAANLLKTPKVLFEDKRYSKQLRWMYCLALLVLSD